MSERATGRKLGIVIVDDEPPARDLLDQYLAGLKGYVVLAKCANGFEAVRDVDKMKPDLLLLDIQMPKLDGFEVLQLLGHRPEVIFTTAHDEYALKAFEIHAVDYLLKPFTKQRLLEALEVARGRIERGERQPLEDLGRAHDARSGAADRLLVREGAKIHVVASGSIDYVEAQDDYVFIRAGKLGLRKKQTLSELEKRLQPAGFVRIHRCYLLNVSRLARIEPYAKDSRVVILRDGTRLPVSRAGYERLKRLL